MDEDEILTSKTIKDAIVTRQAYVEWLDGEKRAMREEQQAVEKLTDALRNSDPTMHATATVADPRFGSYTDDSVPIALERLAVAVEEQRNSLASLAAAIENALHDGKVVTGEHQALTEEGGPVTDAAKRVARSTLDSAASAADAAKATFDLIAKQRDEEE